MSLNSMALQKEMLILVHVRRLITEIHRLNHFFAVNIDNKVGAIGFVSRILPSVYPISIIRADQNTGEPIRGPDGLCQVIFCGN